MDKDDFNKYGEPPLKRILKLIYWKRFFQEEMIKIMLVPGQKDYENVKENQDK